LGKFAGQSTSTLRRRCRNPTAPRQAVYLIYDFYPRDEFGDGERDLGTDSDNWGQLPGDRSGQQFSVAKIADEITELRFGRTFELRDALDYPVELVRTVKTPEDTIIRATIA
jgi:hypothetical protein